jgi:hypothetical protein
VYGPHTSGVGDACAKSRGCLSPSLAGFTRRWPCRRETENSQSNQPDASLATILLEKLFCSHREFWLRTRLAQGCGSNEGLRISAQLRNDAATGGTSGENSNSQRSTDFPTSYSHLRVSTYPNLLQRIFSAIKPKWRMNVENSSICTPSDAHPVCGPPKFQLH